MGIVLPGREAMEAEARREMEAFLASRAVAPRNRRALLLAIAVLAALVSGIGVAWDIPGCVAARGASIGVPGSAAPAVGDGFPLLRARRVVIEDAYALAGASWPPNALAAPDKADEAGSVATGMYDPMTGTITVAGDPASSLAARGTLLHEYGHALYEDLCLGYEYRGGVGEYLATLRAQMALNVNKRTPLWLSRAVVPEDAWPVLDAYRASLSPSYGDPHYENCFAEYFAESFGRHAASQVPWASVGAQATILWDDGLDDPAADAAMAGISEFQRSLP